MDLDKYKPNREFLLYKTPNGNIKVDVLLQNETIWMPPEKDCRVVRCKCASSFKTL